ncbi:MAG: hypothetical protein OJF50_006719 [Nitrospira sp.]|jgi:hypothetical protein|nr:hypothetical protein [Nitrospira sp.]
MRLRRIADSELPHKILDMICPLPSPRDFSERTFNTDVFDMSPVMRAVEQERVRLRLLVDPRPHHWVQHRFYAIKAANDRAAERRAR